MAGPDPARAFLGSAAPAGRPDQARRCLRKNAADPRRPRGTAGGADEAASWTRPRSAAGLGTEGPGHPRPQQGRLRPGQQAGPAAVGDGPPRHAVRSAPRQRTPPRCVARRLRHTFTASTSRVA
uniref:Uncharacterized protein n=1 Tax=Pseudomonas aeruginosa TaxID=287 RepID=A0A0K2SQY9_PSEAI|nr:hypothetical protein [Pseudomonas aeruginosa]